MGKDPLGIAVLGAGNIAGAHLHALQQLPEGRLVAAADVNLERARLALDRHTVVDTTST